MGLRPSPAAGIGGADESGKRQCLCGCGRTAPMFTFNPWRRFVNAKVLISTDISQVLSVFTGF
jgi:hypothetical protein